MYKVLFKKSAEKEIEKLPAAVVKKLSPAIDGLSINPRPKGCIKLQSQKENTWRIRVGDYRIVYLIEDIVKIVEIRRVAHRRQVYD